MRKLAVIGSGGHARETIEAAQAAGFAIQCLLDDAKANWGRDVLGLPVLPGGLAAVSDLGEDVELVVAIGDNRARARIAGALKGRRFATIIHPFSWISPTARIGVGAMIFAGVVVQTEAIVGDHAILNTGATISHDVVADDCCHVAVGAHMAGNVHVGEGAKIGAGAAARPGARIGNWATVGAGAVVIQDIPDGMTAFGGGVARIRD